MNVTEASKALVLAKAALEKTPEFLAVRRARKVLESANFRELKAYEKARARRQKERGT